MRTTSAILNAGVALIFAVVCAHTAISGLTMTSVLSGWAAFCFAACAMLDVMRSR